MPLQQFSVPQFIDVEDKIIAFITIRQFTIMIVAVVLSFVWYKVLAFPFFLLGIIVTMLLAGGLAFIRVNGRPVHYFLLNFIQTAKRPGIRIWNKEAYVYGVQEIRIAAVAPPTPIPRKPTLGGSKLTDLTLLLNTGGVYQTEGTYGEAENLSSEPEDMKRGS